MLISSVILSKVNTVDHLPSITHFRSARDGKSKSFNNNTFIFLFPFYIANFKILITLFRRISRISCTCSCWHTARKIIRKMSESGLPASKMGRDAAIFPSVNSSKFARNTTISRPKVAALNRTPKCTDIEIYRNRL